MHTLMWEYKNDIHLQFVPPDDDDEQGLSDASRKPHTRNSGVVTVCVMVSCIVEEWLSPRWKCGNINRNVRLRETNKNLWGKFGIRSAREKE